MIFIKKWRIHTFSGMKLTEVKEAQDYEKKQDDKFKKNMLSAVDYICIKWDFHGSML